MFIKEGLFMRVTPEGTVQVLGEAHDIDITLNCDDVLPEYSFYEDAKLLLANSMNDMIDASYRAGLSPADVAAVLSQVADLVAATATLGALLGIPSNKRS